jgi:hypothetical protein
LDPSGVYVSYTDFDLRHAFLFGAGYDNGPEAISRKARREG